MEANKLYELNKLDLAKSHVDIIQICILSLFYTFLTPLAPIIALIGLILYYNITYYLLLRY